MPLRSDSRNAALSLAAMALLGILLLFLFPGSAEQDAPYHFLESRDSWTVHTHFVSVWARPFYTTLFAFPALLGLTAARILALAVGLSVAWQTWKLARDLGLPNAWLVIPLLLGEPVFFQLYPDLLTEPTFALLFVVALRLHLAGWKKSGMCVASLLPLARPEGFFLGILWGLWILRDASQQSHCRPLLAILRAVPSTLLLASGALLWWLSALALTGDPLFILHDWPRTWHQGTYGYGSVFAYVGRAWEFAGPLLIVPLVLGLILKTRDGCWLPVTSPVVLFFVLHSIFRMFSLFGEAGYPRYMVSVSPALAVLTLAGWNAIFTPGLLATVTGACVLALSIFLSFFHTDSLIWSRDTMAIREMNQWWKDHPRPVNSFIWSNAYMSVEQGPRFARSTPLEPEKARNLQLLRQSPPGTFIFWDDQIGPDWFGLTAEDIEAEGFQLLRAKSYALDGILPGWTATRKIQLSLLYKP